MFILHIKKNSEQGRVSNIILRIFSEKREGYPQKTPLLVLLCLFLALLGPFFALFGPYLTLFGENSIFRPPGWNFFQGQGGGHSLNGGEGYPSNSVPFTDKKVGSKNYFSSLRVCIIWPKSSQMECQHCSMLYVFSFHHFCCDVNVGLQTKSGNL